MTSPTAAEFQRNLADSINNIGNTLMATGKRVEALEALESARSDLPEACRRQPFQQAVPERAGGHTQQHWEHTLRHGQVS